MKKTKKIISLAFAAIMSLSLTACNGGGASNAPVASVGDSSATVAVLAPAANTADTGEVLNVHFDVEIASMDTQLGSDGASFEAIAAVIEGLYSVDEAGSPIPALAESTEKSEDGLTYTFKLRDAKWSSGAPVTANDFVFAWRRLVDPAVASEYSFMAGVACIVNADEIIAGEKPLEELGVRAIDEKTLEVKLNIPVPFFESIMAFTSFRPLNEEFYIKAGDSFATSPETINCNGAFVVTSYEPAANTIVLTKNPDYYDADKIKLSGMKFQIIKDSQQAMLSYQNGDLDIVTLAGEQVDLFNEDPEFQSIMTGYLWYLSPNQKVAGLENINLRKAIALSFDKEAIVNNVLKDGSIVSDFLVPTLLATGPDGKDFRETTGKYLSTDKAKALEYWNTAKSEIGVETLTYKMIVEDTESAINVAQFIKAQVEDTLPGLTIEIEQMPKKNRVQRMQSGDYEIGLTRWGPDYADPMTYLDMWTTGSPNNYGSWSNAEFDAIVESCKKGELAINPEKRWEALKEAEKIAADNAVIMPIYQKGNAVMIKSGVKGIEFHSVGVKRIFKNTVKSE